MRKRVLKNLKCKYCKNHILVVFSCRYVYLLCNECGAEFKISDYLDEIDEETWDMISRRSCDRA
ncbi:MAG: hypothetical protein NZ809_01265 [Thermodesulfovibrio sp.]|nr:hypothetical protein [Thermodesulfovibrio sp.]